jgi:hypothetical protein
VADPYKEGKAKASFYAAKRAVTGTIVAVLDAKMESRGLYLIPQASRALRRGDIVELVTTDEAAAAPASTVNHVAYIGFAEIESGGMVLVGDAVSIGRQHIGEVCGFDETHVPNHMNIVIGTSERKTGSERAIALSAPIEFKTANT